MLRLESTTPECRRRFVCMTARHAVLAGISYTFAARDTADAHTLSMRAAALRKRAWYCFITVAGLMRAFQAGELRMKVPVGMFIRPLRVTSVYVGAARRPAHVVFHACERRRAKATSEEVEREKVSRPA